MEVIDVTKHLSATDIYPEFKRWLKETYPYLKVIPKGKFTDMLSTKDKLGKQQNRRWWGIAMKQNAVATIIE